VSDFDGTAGLVVGLVGGSHLINHAYFMLLPPIFGALQRDLGITTAQSGLALGLLGAVVVALQLPLGYVSDTYSRTLVLGLSLTVGTVGALVIATAGSYPWLLAGAVVTGCGIGGHHPAHYPMLSAATDPAARGRAFSIHGFAGALGYAIPPAAVGAATALGLGWRTGVAAVAALGACYAAGCLWTVRRRVPRTVTHAPGSKARGGGSPADGGGLAALPRRLLGGLRATVSSTAIVLLTLLWFLVMVSLWGMQAYTAPLLTGAYGVAEGTANLLVSAMLVVGAVAILGGGWLTDRYGSRPVVLGALAGTVAVAGTLASGLLPVVLAAGLTLVSVAAIKATRPALSTLGDALSPAGDLGKNFGLLTIGISGGSAVAPPVFGALSDAASIQWVFRAIAGVAVLAFLFTFVVLAVGERATASGVAPAEQ
jgi:MFS family permease